MLSVCFQWSVLQCDHAVCVFIHFQWSVLQSDHAVCVFIHFQWSVLQSDHAVCVFIHFQWSVLQSDHAVCVFIHFQWSVLLCGHCFCMACIQLVIENSSRGLHPAASVSLKCAVCREKTKTGEISYVSTTRSTADDSSPAVKVIICLSVSCLSDHAFCIVSSPAVKVVICQSVVRSCILYCI